MPELPEVETVRRTLLPHVLGRHIVAVTVREPRLRTRVDADALTTRLVGGRVTAVRRRAKYLLFDVAQGDAPSVLLVHLGMSGCLGIAGVRVPLLTHDHVLWTLEGERQLRLNDARRFGMVDAFAPVAEADHPRLRALGPEPLDPDAFTGAKLYASSRGSSRPIKALLMDAAEVVGVGNIYASEALHLAGIHPLRAAGRLSLARCVALVAAVRTTLHRAIEEGGTTLRDFIDVDGHRGAFADRLTVYGRGAAGCLTCQAPIRRVVLTGRATFYCPRCQR